MYPSRRKNPGESMTLNKPQSDPSESSDDIPALMDSDAPVSEPTPVHPAADQEEEPIDTSSGSEDMPSPGNTTAGFDTVLGKIVVESGLVTTDELEQCLEESRSIDNPDDPRTLSDPA